MNTKDKTQTATVCQKCGLEQNSAEAAATWKRKTNIKQGECLACNSPLTATGKPELPTHARIERHELIAVDTHKAFSYDKSTGFWSWYDRDEPETLYGVFDTRLEALIDAVAPYTA